MAYEYDTLEVSQTGGVITATINNPPVNVMTVPLYTDLVSSTSEVEVDESVRVVVFQSGVSPGPGSNTGSSPASVKVIAIAPLVSSADSTRAGSSASRCMTN